MNSEQTLERDVVRKQRGLNSIFAPCIMESIQGVTGGTDQTSGECSLGQTIPI